MQGDRDAGVESAANGGGRGKEDVGKSKKKSGAHPEPSGVDGDGAEGGKRRPHARRHPGRRGEEGNAGVDSAGPGPICGKGRKRKMRWGFWQRRLVPGTSRAQLIDGDGVDTAEGSAGK